MEDLEQWNGLAVRLRRVAKSMTVEDLCSAVTDLGGVGVTKSTVHRWEQGYEPRADEHRVALGRVLGCSATSFYRVPVVVDAAE